MTAASPEPSEKRPRRGVWSRFPLRARLTLAFTALVAVAGVVMIVVASLYMRFVPVYAPTVPAPESEVSDPTPTSGAPIVRTSADSGGELVTLGSPIEILNASTSVSLVVLVTVVLLGAVLAWVLSGRLLRPLHRINEAAKLAATGSFDHRVGLTGAKDEVSDLAETFDDMIERLGRSFAAQRRFAANASHELRTPLATTRTILDVALADPDASADDLRAAASKVLETNRRSSETVDALLNLAVINQGAPPSTVVDFTELVHAVIDDRAAEASQKNLQMTLALTPQVSVHGDPTLLRLAVSNLLINAIRHNVRAGHIDIDLRPEDGAVRLRIENSGKQIPPATVGQLTEPFTRAGGRIRGPADADGHGLGLAIVADILASHSGSLDLSAREDGGLTVVAALPSSRPASSL